MKYLPQRHGVYKNLLVVHCIRFWMRCTTGLPRPELQRTSKNDVQCSSTLGLQLQYSKALGGNVLERSVVFKSAVRGDLQGGGVF